MSTNLNADEQAYLFNNGVKKLQVGDIKGSIEVFQFLCTVDIDNYMYSKSLAGALHHEKNYLMAAYFYDLAFRINDKRNNYDALYYSALCHMKTEHLEDAITNLEKFLELLNNDEIATIDYDALLKKSKLLLHGLKNKKVALDAAATNNNHHTEDQTSVV